MTKVEHGANLFEISKTYGFDLSEIMDFSSNINPFGASEKALAILRENPHLVSIYPDPAYLKLRQSIESYIGIPSDHIILGSGATALISGLIEEIAPKNALIQKPAYSEYEKELSKHSTTIWEYVLSAKELFVPSVDQIIQLACSKQCELIVLCNPNNPTGSLLSTEDIEKILCKTQAYVMVDETYIEFTDAKTFSSAALIPKYEKLFVIRGTSKFFSTPGIRLGYGLSSSQRILDAFKNLSHLWGINIFADVMGTAMFTDKEYHQKTYDLICTERNYLIKELSAFEDFQVFTSYGNFILSRILSERFTAKDLYNELLKQKIIIRDCKSFDGLSEYYFRVCTLKPEENQLLIRGITEFISSIK